LKPVSHFIGSRVETGRFQAMGVNWIQLAQPRLVVHEQLGEVVLVDVLGHRDVAVQAVDPFEKAANFETKIHFYKFEGWSVSISAFLFLRPFLVVFLLVGCSVFHKMSKRNFFFVFKLWGHTRFDLYSSPHLDAVQVLRVFELCVDGPVRRAQRVGVKGVIAGQLVGRVREGGVQLKVHVGRVRSERKVHVRVRSEA
jgi:hypothetical protein